MNGSKFNGMSYADLVRHAGYTGSTEQQIAATLALADRVDHAASMVSLVGQWFAEQMIAPHAAHPQKDADAVRGHPENGWYVVCPQCGGSSIGGYVGDDYDAAQARADQHNAHHPGGAALLRASIEAAGVTA